MRKKRGPFLIGILGGVASGKSAAASFFAEMGAERVDADAISTEVIARPEIRNALGLKFGKGIFDAGGAVNRGRLAEAAFGTGEEGVRILNEIMHPPIMALVQERISRSAGTAALVLDLPLLLEKGLARMCDLLVFVDAPEEKRISFAAARGWAPGEIRRREAFQASLAEKKKAAEIAIKNDKSLDELRLAVQNTWRIRVRPHLSTIPDS